MDFLKFILMAMALLLPAVHAINGSSDSVLPAWGFFVTAEQWSILGQLNWWSDQFQMWYHENCVCACTGFIFLIWVYAKEKWHLKQKIKRNQAINVFVVVCFVFSWSTKSDKDKTDWLSYTGRQGSNSWLTVL